jgi:hypothetical protein
VADEKTNTLRYFLNAVDPDVQSIGNVTPGAWQLDDNVASPFLRRYAESVAISGEVADLGLIHSVPSVYARPILFAQAIGSKARGTGDGKQNTDVTGPVHKAVRAEWRGLVAAFAFSDYFGYRISVKNYEVAPLENIPQEYAGVGGSDDNYFRIMLRSQLPKPESAWKNFNLIYCDGNLIGATSPLTLVYTPAHYNCPPVIPWVRTVKRKQLDNSEAEYRVFADPVEYFREKRGRRDLKILDLWLNERLAEHTLNKWNFKSVLLQDSLSDTWSGNIKREIDAWRKDIAAAKLEGQSITISAGSQHLSDAPYRFFLRGCTLDAGTEKLSQSDILLDVKDPATEVLVFSREAGADKKGRVYGSVYGDQVDVAKLKPSVEGSWKTELGREIPVGYVVAEDVFFPKKLAELPLGPKAISCGSKRFALPLTSAFLKYFEARDLSAGGKVKLKVTELPGHIIARLELPLRSGGSLAAERQYSVDNSDQVMPLPTTPSVPAMAVWPDFEDASWRSHIAVYVGGSAPDATLKLNAAPVGPGGVVHRATTLDGTQKSSRIWESTEPLAGFVLTEHRPDGRGAEVGLVLASFLRLEPVDRESSLDVSVDFGTSNTVLAYTARDTGKKLLGINGRSCLLTSSVNDRYSEAFTRGFYPEGPIEQPFVTALKDQQAGVSFLEGKLDYQLVVQVDATDAPTMVANVKWGTTGGTADELPMKAFLTHVVRLLMAQARADCYHKVNLRWSYPLALPSPVKVAMRSFWTTLNRQFCDPAVVTLTVGKDGITESDAVCRQLAHLEPVVNHVQSEAVTVMIDVGGGSTDIGIWSESKLLEQISAKLAGNDILDRHILRSATFLESFEKATGLNLGTAEDLKINLVVNAALARLARNAGPDPYNHPVAQEVLKSPAVEPWASLRSLIYTHFAGVTYFVGLAARRYM